MPKVTVPGLDEASGDLSYKPWDEGWYYVEIETPPIVSTKPNGNLSVRLDCILLDGPSDQSSGREVSGGTVAGYYTISPNPFTLEMFKNCTNALGVTVGPGGTFESTDFIGKRAWVLLNIELDNKGEPRNRYRRWSSEKPAE